MGDELGDVGRLVRGNARLGGEHVADAQRTIRRVGVGLSAVEVDHLLEALDDDPVGHAFTAESQAAELVEARPAAQHEHGHVVAELVDDDVLRVSGDGAIFERLPECRGWRPRARRPPCAGVRGVGGAKLSLAEHAAASPHVLGVVA